MVTHSKEEGIPVGCVPLSYIEGTGSQWIDTEKIVYANEDVFFDFQMVDWSSNVMYMGWRWQGGATNSNQCVVSKDTSYNSLRLIYGCSAAGGIPVYKDKTYSRNSFYISPTKKIILLNENEAAGTYDTTYTFAYNGEKGGVYSSYLFTFNNNGNLYKAYSKMRLYEYSLTSADGNYTQRLIPILDKNGVACMYDTVRKKYHYNKGTGEFLYKILEQ